MAAIKRETSELVDRRPIDLEEGRPVLQRVEKTLAGPPPRRVTLAQARAEWPEWEAAQDRRRREARRTVTERSGPALASFLVDVHLPKLPPPTEVVAYALELECGHEDFWLQKRADESAESPKWHRCPTYWSCQLSAGRTAIRYLESAEPEPQFPDMDLTRWSVALACGHDKEVLRAKDEVTRIGEYLICCVCEPETPTSEVRVVTLGERLPPQMVQNWTVDLSCGHVGTDHFVPVEHAGDPAAYRARRPSSRGLRCSDDACNEREVTGFRRLGVLGKIRAPKPPPPPVDPVALAATDLRRRLTKEERQALIQELQDDER